MNTTSMNATSMNITSMNITSMNTTDMPIAYVHMEAANVNTGDLEGQLRVALSTLAKLRSSFESSAKMISHATSLSDTNAVVLTVCFGVGIALFMLVMSMIIVHKIKNKYGRQRHDRDEERLSGRARARPRSQKPDYAARQTRRASLANTRTR